MITMGKVDTSDLMMMITWAIDSSFQSPILKWASWTHTTPYYTKSYHLLYFSVSYHIMLSSEYQLALIIWYNFSSNVLWFFWSNSSLNHRASYIIEALLSCPFCMCDYILSAVFCKHFILYLTWCYECVNDAISNYHYHERLLFHWYWHFGPCSAYFDFFIKMFPNYIVIWYTFIYLVKLWQIKHRRCDATQAD